MFVVCCSLREQQTAAAVSKRLFCLFMFYAILHHYRTRCQRIFIKFLFFYGENIYIMCILDTTLRENTKNVKIFEKLHSFM